MVILKSYSKHGVIFFLCLTFFVCGVGYATGSKKSIVNKTSVKQTKKIKGTKPIAAKPLVKKVGIIKTTYKDISIDESIKISDLIAKVEIVKKTKEIDKPACKTFFDAKILNIYEGQDKLKNVSKISIIQDGNSNWLVNGNPMFENKEKLILILKKVPGYNNTFNIISGSINTYKIVEADGKSYVVKEEKVDRLLQDIDVFEQEAMSSINNNKPLPFSKVINKYKPNEMFQVFMENSFESRLEELIKAQHSLFITNYNANQVDKTLVNSSNIFGFNIFKGETANIGSENKNVIISPISLFTAFNVVANGASGKTKEQINGILGTNNYTQDKLNNEMNNLINYLNSNRSDGCPGDTEIYNSLWVDKAFKVKDSYINDSMKYYNSDIFNEVLSSKKTVDDMNNWINEKSKGLIKDPIHDIDKNTKLSIFNVLHFMGKWQKPFQKSLTKEDSFTTSSGEELKVQMMNDERLMGYYEDEDTKAGIFNYYNGSMMILLPKGDINTFINKLTSEDISKYSDSAKMYITKVKMPKLNIEYNNDIISTLNKMGMVLPFDSNKAEFDNLKANNDPLCISKVVHNCVVKLDEDGTEAAALTSVGMAGAMRPPDEKKEFYVNKPFIFVIEQYGNLILFVGKVENPNK